MSGTRTAILKVVGVAVIMLVIGVAIGSVAFPMTRTKTTTQLSTVIFTQGSSSTVFVYTGVFTTTSFSLITPTDSNPQWNVITAPLTVYYAPACMIIETFDFSCPTLDTVRQLPSLDNVELVSYQGNYYYVVNYSFSFNLQSKSYLVWFTNSTIFCITPKYGNFNVCP